jgi:hypothetical protein
MSKYKGKEKFPELKEPPEFPHTLEENLIRGANATTIWWDCKTCKNRVVETNKAKSITKYFAVPACAGTPGASKNLKPPVPADLKQSVPVPPLWRKPSEVSGYSEEEKNVLQQARAILEAKAKSKPSTASSSQDASNSKADPKKRSAPKNSETMEVSSGEEFEPVFVKEVQAHFHQRREPSTEEIIQQIETLTLLLKERQGQGH